jgi:hypothetical protein
MFAIEENQPQEIQHTPTPWINAGITHEGDAVPGLLITGANKCVAFVTNWDEEMNINEIQPQVSANADFILRACNSHDAMLDVCNGMQDLIDRCGLKVNAEFQEALNRAVALAEGKA